MNSISQIYINELKKRIEVKISSLSSNMVDTIIKSLSSSYNQEQYFSFISNIQEDTREMIKTIIINTFEELDLQFRNSSERLKKYVINKSNVSRTIITIFGEITFNRTYYKSRLDGKKYFYIDSIFKLPKYDHYDPTVKAIAIDKASKTSPAESGRSTGEYINPISNLFNNKRILNHIPRQSIYNWIHEWNIPNYKYEQSPNTPSELYIMFDEKFIGCQNLETDIMIKSMVVFEGIKDVCKGRRELVNRTIYNVYSSYPWDDFVSVLSQKYDLSKIKTIYLLADGGNWIKKGLEELKTEPETAIKFLLCEYHFKQSINRITTNKILRKNILDSFIKDKKKIFKKKVKKIIKDTGITEYKNKNLNYILNNYSYIKAMLNSKIGSSMESHISHFVASTFSSRPKGYSSKKIHQYLKLNNYSNNNVNIINLYKLTYDKKEIITINENELNYDMFDSKRQIPILANGETTGTYKALKSLIY